MRQRLGVVSVLQDTGQGQVTGQGSVYGGLGTITLKNTTNDYSDCVTPDAAAELAFSGNKGNLNAGVDKDGAYYRTTFAGFGVERMFTSGDRSRTLLTFLQCATDWLAWTETETGRERRGLRAGDATAWTAPSQVTDFAVSRERSASAGRSRERRWAIYDLVRSANPADFWNATCVAYGVPETSVPAAWTRIRRPERRSSTSSGCAASAGHRLWEAAPTGRRGREPPAIEKEREEMRAKLGGRSFAKAGAVAGSSPWPFSPLPRRRPTARSISGRAPSTAVAPVRPHPRQAPVSLGGGSCGSRVPSAGRSAALSRQPAPASWRRCRTRRSWWMSCPGGRSRCRRSRACTGPFPISPGQDRAGGHAGVER